MALASLICVPIGVGAIVALYVESWLLLHIVSRSNFKMMPAAAFVMLAASMLAVSYIFFRVFSRFMSAPRGIGALPLFSGLLWLNISAVLVVLQVLLIFFARLK